MLDSKFYNDNIFFIEKNFFIVVEYTIKKVFFNLLIYIIHIIYHLQKYVAD